MPHPTDRQTAGATPAAPSGEPPPGTRTFTHAGVTWTVTERDGSAVPGDAGRGARCLVFASPEVMRRVWEYPPDWCALPDDALVRLSWQR